MFKVSTVVVVVVLVAVCSAAELDADESSRRPYNRPPQYHRPAYEDHHHYEAPRYPAKRPPPPPSYREDYEERPAYQPKSYYPADYCPKVYNLESKCRPAKDCAVWFDLVSATPGTACKLHDGSPGTCCPDLPYNGNTWPRPLVLSDAGRHHFLFRQSAAQLSSRPRRR